MKNQGIQRTVDNKRISLSLNKRPTLNNINSNTSKNSRIPIKPNYRFEKLKEVRKSIKSNVKVEEVKNSEIIELQSKLKKLRESNQTSIKTIEGKKNEIIILDETLNSQRQEMKRRDLELSQIDTYLVQRERLIRAKKEEMEALRIKHSELSSKLQELRSNNGDEEGAEERFTTQINEINHLKSMLLSIRMQLEMTPILLQLQRTELPGVFQINPENLSYEQMISISERVGNVPQGLTKDQIKKIPKYLYRKGVHGEKEGQDPCSICYCEYIEMDKLKKLKCGHSYHSKCLNNWLLIKKQCPICKGEVSAE